MKLYIGNIPFESTKRELQILFEIIGKVKNINIVVDQRTKMPKGFGFIEYEDSTNSEKAIQALNGNKFGGRELIVKPANNSKD